jgi:1-acyl-sn-glycerol-3-phosphate acyltransferase
MHRFNPLHRLADLAPFPVDAALETGASVLQDAADLVNEGIGGRGIEQWDPDYIERTLPLMRATFGTYFRGEVRGLENIPDEGPALLVGNHSGGLMIADTFVFANEFYGHFGPRRRFHQLAHDVAASHPFLGLIRRYGTVPASHENAKAAFDAGAPVLVYPGGDYETFRPSWHSDQVEFGGRKGFVRLALEERVPIIPVVAIGGQETALFVTRGERAARALGLDRLARIKVLPVSIGPPFGINLLDTPFRLPLPAKITVQVLPPIDIRTEFGDRPNHERVYRAVTNEMQDALDELSEERTLPLVG